ncbi:MAG: ornithine carbamoyltransferase [Chloroflexia bacterium]|nr:ornithine carbamoyltransferase [Chloroflexia bacterium]
MHSLYGRDLLKMNDLTSAEVADIVTVGLTLKGRLRRGVPHALLAGKILAMMFFKPSTRTRSAFEVGMTQLGGHAMFLSSNDMQLSRGETIADTARVLERYVHVMMARVFAHSVLTEMAEAARIPVINGLCDMHHPTQTLADLLTIKEHCGGTRGVRFAYVGDGNNMVHSLLHAAPLAGMDIAVATPAHYAPDAMIVKEARALAAQNETDVLITADPYEAVANADIIYTDVWVSMGQTDVPERVHALEPYQVTAKLMSAARPGVKFMHCLPMHRGEEVTAEVADGASSIVFDQAENRLHAHKAVLTMLCSSEAESLL